MKRVLFTIAAVLLTAACADAGPIRDRLAARFARPCQSVQCQPQPQYQPGPVQQVAGNVIQATGQVVQSVGQAVYQLPVIRPSGCQQCVGGVCR